MATRKPENHEKLQAEIEALLVQMGAHRADASEGATYPFTLMTKVGLLNIHPDRDAVFCKFEEPARAAEELGATRVNRNSGKWNFHGADDCRYFMNEIVHILPVPRPAPAETTPLVSLPGVWETTEPGVYVRTYNEDMRLSARLTKDGLLLKAHVPSPLQPGQYQVLGEAALTFREVTMCLDERLEGLENLLRAAQQKRDNAHEAAQKSVTRRLVEGPEL